MSKVKILSLRAHYRERDRREAGLPFVGPAPDRNYPHYWRVPQCRTFPEAFDLGERYGAALLQLFHDYPDHAGNGLLGRIVRDMDLLDFSLQRGLPLGVFHHLEVMMSAGQQEQGAEAPPPA
ncbi:hypothetical protein [Chromobacterium aquaticum]|uniref:Uncharacterized protein n=1 Tax=Chromobacterium aquaticum TaxID=467180 RepID=A0ABV8ZV67_9NEIS|nr:hypothetical protein [Chromobacterium aquaticum]MCD5362696.1 hypothetical protein [Chromobacterium aquaticum]